MTKVEIRNCLGITYVAYIEYFCTVPNANERMKRSNI